MSQRSDTEPQPDQSYVTCTLIRGGTAMATGETSSAASASNPVFMRPPHPFQTAAQRRTGSTGCRRPPGGGLLQRRREGSTLLGNLHVGVEPVQHFRHQLLVRFQRGVPVRLVRQHHQAGGTAVATDRLVQLARLERLGTRVGVILAVHQQQRQLDLVGVEERRGLQVHVLRLPYRATLVLEAERGEGLVVRTTGGHARLEKIGVRDQVGGHQATMAVTGHADAVAVNHTHVHCLVHRRLGVGFQLLQVGVIGVLRVAHDRERGIVDDRVAGQQHQAVRLQAGEGLLRTGHLPGLRGVGEVGRVRVQDRRHALSFLVTRRRVQGERQVHAIGTLVAQWRWRRTAPRRPSHRPPPPPAGG
ncbi:hypothetical protein G6F24_013433 [Rhizopus arrhizus]|nr:hypothetical protein G6F24_013433 [Rhizopus arrhizus]